MNKQKSTELNFLERIAKRLFTIIGDVVVSKRPLWISYAPEQHKFKGKEYYKFVKKCIEDNSFLQFGDILLRCYDSYLDSYLIPGELNHAGIYVGWNQVIHSISDGVVREPITDFIRTDHFIVVRPRGVTNKERWIATRKAVRFLGWKYDFSFRYGNDCRLYCTELVGRAWEHVKDKFKFKMVNHYGRKGLSADSILLSDVDIVFATESVKKFKIYKIKEKIENEQ